MLQRGPRSVRSRRSSVSGQVLILFAASLVVLVGMAGLATDLGFSFAERRTMQNAADAGAMAGARIVAKATTTNPLSAWSDVQSLVDQNRIGSTNPTITECVYVSDPDSSGNEQDLGDCTGTVPKASGPVATGVRVTVQETHNTFLMQAVPGAPTQASTAATATAHVMVPIPPSNGPFLVCGQQTALTNSTGTQNSGSEDIVTQDASGNWIVNPTLISQINAGNDPWFKIHDPNPNKIQQCGLSGFKAIANQPANTTVTAPGWFTYTNGDVASVASTLDGVDACSGTTLTNCVVILPVVIPNPPAQNSQLYGVMLLPFYIVATAQNAHIVQLVPNYIEYGASKSSQYSWTPGYNGLIVIRMTS